MGLGDACVFCRIANGELDSAKLWEDREFVAILDINPNTKGMALVLTKQHYDSYVPDLPEDVYGRLMLAARKVSKILEKGPGVKRVAMVMEGMGVNHAHIKLYPLHGLAGKFEERWADRGVFFEKYKGYITTQLGPRADIPELKELAEKIIKVGRDTFYHGRI